MTSCRARREGDLLVLENDRMRRTFLWNDGHLIGRQVVDLVRGHAWALNGAVPDVDLSAAAAPTPGAGTLAVRDRPASAYEPARLEVDVTARLGGVEIRRRFRLYPGCPAMACDLYLRGTGAGLWDGEAEGVTVDRLCLPQPHLRLDCVRFYDITDRRNTLVTRQTAIPFRHEGRMAGNLLLIRDPLAGQGLFLLKEAPCSDVQLAWPGYDFAHRLGEIRVVGAGVVPTDLEDGTWTRGYGTVLGVAPVDLRSSSAGEYGNVSCSELGLLSALRTYQRQIRTYTPGRDEMVLLNTWGDRGQDTRISAAFAMDELARGAQLGVSHFQLDDGWQAGRSSNSAYAGGSLEGIWDEADYWTPHPERFPAGLGPVVERARALGIELCVWFNPSKDDSYAHWEADAEVLIGLYRAHGIRTFKIDGVLLPDKRADRNLRAMFERVMAATEGEAVFNLDVTAGRRWGYHYGNAYGNIFLENRYTDWVNYYPHWTLRNLWMLSPYVPAQNLQIEFLNKWRNADRYPADDPLAPARVPFDYCFAVTMAAQPLAWLEATGLPEEAFAIAPLVRTYREHQARLHEGLILPIGEEPSGCSWTGFQSMREGAGYLLVYREWTERPSARLRLWGLAGQRVRVRCIAGQGSDFVEMVGADGGLEVRLPGRFTFGLYGYEAEK